MGGRVHRLDLQRSKTPHKECPKYNTKQSDGEVGIMRVLWGTPSLFSLRGPLKSGVVAPDWVFSIGQIGLNTVINLN